MPTTTARGRYRAGPRTPHSVRLAEDTKATMKKAVAGGEAADVQQWGERVIEAALGYVRCHRGSCVTATPPIPVTFGDLTGMTFGEAAAKAVELAEDQHLSGHGPVFVGAEPAAGPRRPASPGAPVHRAEAAARS